MSKKLKTTTNKKNILIKAIIFAFTFLIVISVMTFTSNVAQDRTLFVNATLVDNKEKLIEKIVEETAEDFNEETGIIKTDKDKNSIIIDKIYCVVSGDSYSKICKMFYNNENLCWALMEYNDANGNTILHIGQELKIPDIDNEEFAKLIENVAKPQLKKTTKTVKTQSAMANMANSKSVKYRKDSQQQSTSTVTNANYSAPTVSGNVKNNSGYVDTSEFTYLGSYRITGYTPGCAHCCGNTKGITASGVPAVIGRTIAAKGFNFGQTLYIKGYGFYVVEDRGSFASGTIDMAAGSHEACYSITASGVDVYLVPNN